MGTGLKYFGKTQQKDPYKYMGSGDYWVLHIKKHGYDKVITCVIAEFENETDCEAFALNFSIENNIVESREWANLKLENGKDGWIKGQKQSSEAIEKRRIKNTGKKRTDETKRLISAAKSGPHHPYSGKTGENSHWYGRKHTPESIAKMKAKKARDINPLTGRKRPVEMVEKMKGKNNPFYGKTHSNETKLKISNAKKGGKITDKHREKISGANSKVSKFFIAISPEGIKYEGKGVTAFSKEHGLLAHNMLDVARGVRKSHKGWVIRYV